MHTNMINRRQMLAGAAALSGLTLAGCASVPPPKVQPAPKPVQPYIPPNILAHYGPRPDERFPVRAANITDMDPRFYRQMVDDPTGEPPGTVVVDTPSRFLYWVMPGGRAMRYGAGIGRDGFAWGGRARIAYKRKWPTWTPPVAMIERQPELEQYRNGMEPGLTNPLGARALYIHEGGRDTLYRVHGTMEEWSIGKAVSSGCVRLLFQDVIDLCERVPDGSPILVRQ
ncbi:MAG: L,D-transpeptidase [Rhizobiaceae bacterium]|nr:L,D-transpeptidase [Rhizobiaceae bacterium]